MGIGVSSPEDNLNNFRALFDEPLLLKTPFKIIKYINTRWNSFFSLRRSGYLYYFMQQILPVEILFNEDEIIIF